MVRCANAQGSKQISHRRFLKESIFIGGKELEMKKMMVMAAFVAAVMAGSVASAASVDILVSRDVPGSSATWTLSVRTDIDMQALVIQTSGFTSRTLASLATISPLDSPFVNGGLQVNAPAGQNVLAPGGAAYTVLATLTGPTGPFAYSITDGEGTFGYTILDNTGTPLAVGTLGDNTPGTFSLTVNAPEPASAVLLGLGLAGLAMIRRKAA